MYINFHFFKCSIKRRHEWVNFIYCFKREIRRKGQCVGRCMSFTSFPVASNIFYKLKDKRGERERKRMRGGKEKRKEGGKEEGNRKKPKLRLWFIWVNILSTNNNYTRVGSRWFSVIGVERGWWDCLHFWWGVINSYMIVVCVKNIGYWKYINIFTMLKYSNLRSHLCPWYRRGSIKVFHSDTKTYEIMFDVLILTPSLSFIIIIIYGVEVFITNWGFECFFLYSYQITIRCKVRCVRGFVYS